LVYARFGQENSFFWDERANTLEAQTTQPIQDHIEMGFSGMNGDPDLDSLIRKLSVLPYYQQLFPQAFNGSTAITEERMQFALAQFVRSIQSFDSKYDIGLAAAGGDLNANFTNFSTAENEGKALYMNDGRNGSGCDRCHQAPEFDIDNNIGNNGVITTAPGSPLTTDLMNTRSPTLRDLFNSTGDLNGPLMHDGSLTTIDQVLDHYSDVPNNANLDNRLQGRGGQRNFDATERGNLIAFFKTLTSVAIYTEEKWSDPFDSDNNLEILNGMCATDAKVGTPISTGSYDLNAASSIVSTNVINNATVTYKANNSITLYPGFHATLGSTFSASIETCMDGLLADNVVESRIINEIRNIQVKASLTTQNNLLIYPNPFKQTLTFNLGTHVENVVDVYIFNSVGQQVKFLQFNHETSLDLGQLEKGIYFVKVIQAGQLLHTKKIVKG